MGNDDVGKMARALHKAGAMNLDMKLSDMLQIEGVGNLDPDSAVAAHIVAWDGYVAILADKSKREEMVLPRADVKGRLSGRG